MSFELSQELNTPTSALSIGAHTPLLYADDSPSHMATDFKSDSKAQPSTRDRTQPAPVLTISLPVENDRSHTEIQESAAISKPHKIQNSPPTPTSGAVWYRANDDSETRLSRVSELVGILSHEKDVLSYLSKELCDVSRFRTYESSNGALFFINADGVSHWSHPESDLYRERIRMQRKALHDWVNTATEISTTTLQVQISQLKELLQKSSTRIKELHSYIEKSEEQQSAAVNKSKILENDVVTLNDQIEKQNACIHDLTSAVETIKKHQGFTSGALALQLYDLGRNTAVIQAFLRRKLIPSVQTDKGKNQSVPTESVEKLDTAVDGSERVVYSPSNANHQKRSTPIFSYGSSNEKEEKTTHFDDRVVSDTYSLPSTSCEEVIVDSTSNNNNNSTQKVEDAEEEEEEVREDNVDEDDDDDMDGFIQTDNSLYSNSVSNFLRETNDAPRIRKGKNISFKNSEGRNDIRGAKNEQVNRYAKIYKKGSDLPWSPNKRVCQTVIYDKRALTKEEREVQKLMKLTSHLSQQCSYFQKKESEKDRKLSASSRSRSAFSHNSIHSIYGGKNNNISNSDINIYYMHEKDQYIRSKFAQVEAKVRSLPEYSNISKSSYFSQYDNRDLHNSPRLETSNSQNNYDNYISNHRLHSRNAAELNDGRIESDDNEAIDIAEDNSESDVYISQDAEEQLREEYDKMLQQQYTDAHLLRCVKEMQGWMKHVNPEYLANAAQDIRPVTAPEPSSANSRNGSSFRGRKFKAAVEEEEGLLKQASPVFGKSPKQLKNMLFSTSNICKIRGEGTNRELLAIVTPGSTTNIMARAVNAPLTQLPPAAGRKRNQIHFAIENSSRSIRSAENGERPSQEANENARRRPVTVDSEFTSSAEKIDLDQANDDDIEGQNPTFEAKPPTSSSQLSGWNSQGPRARRMRVSAPPKERNSSPPQGFRPVTAPDSTVASIDSARQRRDMKGASLGREYRPGWRTLVASAPLVAASTGEIFSVTRPNSMFDASEMSSPLANYRLEYWQRISEARRVFEN